LQVTQAPRSSNGWLLCGIVLLAAGLRVGYVLAEPDLLRRDIDDYRALAAVLATEGRFDDQATGEPTAYRPVLYPLMLAGLVKLFGPADWPIAALHVLLGMATVVLVWVVGGWLGGSMTAIVAAGATAVDPLLVHWAAYPMTETTSAFLLALAVWAVLCIRQGQAGRFALPAGVILGLGALCRPIIWGWALAVLALVKFRSDLSPKARLSAVLCLLLGFVGVQLPWFIRNWTHMGAPIWTTTHGGYTFHLGNNERFYRDVVANPGKDVWSSEGLSAWRDPIEHETRKMTEPQRDGEYYARAWAFIQQDPHAFIESSWLKLRRLWGLAPHEMYSPTVRAAVGVFYAIVLALFALGLFVGRCWRWPGVFLVAVPLVFSLAHTFYWSNMRMRAPLVPVIAVFVGLAANRLWALGSGLWDRGRNVNPKA
jgi:4-amino-4-deoxy-L-arabinose transferase-like glycosyltransferase